MRRSIFTIFRNFLAPIVCFALCVSFAQAGTMQVHGKMDSTIHFAIEKTIYTADATDTFYLSFVVPKTYTSPTFSQVVDNFSLRFTPRPNSKKQFTDKRGNDVIEARWSSPPKTIQANIEFDAANTTTLQKLISNAPFPVRKESIKHREYLGGSKQIQLFDPRIQKLAKELTVGLTNQLDAVQSISAWIVDHMRYVSPPKQYDALYSFETGKGNCQNYSHLAAALMRAVDIPVRIVNGVTLDQPFDITMSSGVIRSRMGLGRHSWIEVWFPDLGWVPFNPQNTALYVPNRFIRVELGVDNNEAVADGRAKWIPKRGASQRPTIREDITSDFAKDTVALQGRETQAGPRRRLMLPELESIPQEAAPEVPQKQDLPKDTPAVPQKPAAASSGKPAVQPSSQDPVIPTPAREKPAPKSTEPAPKVSKPAVTPSAPKAVTSNPVSPTPTKVAPKSVPVAPPKPRKTSVSPPEQLQPKRLAKGSRITLGNLDFPENIDFATYASKPTEQNGVVTVTRNFVIETAEYVTTNLRQYAQVVEIAQPMAVTDISLALHRFGGDGMVWIDILQDKGEQPGDLLTTSDIIPLNAVSMRPGYRWVNFSVPKKTILQPGRYWLALGYTGDPILNWFYTYGKPVGPPDGTRFKNTFEEKWSGALSYEFNYRIRGTIR